MKEDGQAKKIPPVAWELHPWEIHGKSTGNTWEIPWEAPLLFA
jgi:hypothetical protein